MLMPPIPDLKSNLYAKLRHENPIFENGTPIQLLELQFELNKIYLVEFLWIIERVVFEELKGA